MENIIELTKKERLVFINQLIIMEMLNPDDACKSARDREALECGYVYEYNDLFHSMDEELSYDKCKEVHDILDMYRVITKSLQELPDSPLNEHLRAKFRGFDGNNEAKFMCYVDYIVNRLDRYVELKEGAKSFDSNSHCPMLEQYRDMLVIWESVKSDVNFMWGTMTEPQIAKILGKDPSLP